MQKAESRKRTSSMILLRSIRRLAICVAAALSMLTVSYAEDRPATAGDQAAKTEKHLLYVAVPGIGNNLQYGGHGVLVFDIDAEHRFVRRIPSAGLDGQNKPINVKGICASESLKRLYVSTIKSLICFDLTNDSILWEKSYDGGCDRMAISPDGKTLYQPSFERDHWHVIDAATGDILARVEPQPGAHNTNYGADGKEAYLAGLRSRELAIADTQAHKIARRVGPFSASIRPFTVNGAQTRCYCCVNDLLGFEVGDLKSGKMLDRVQVQGFETSKNLPHGCPSHGIGLTPDEKEVWVVDSHNKRVHIFDATATPPRQVADVELGDRPGWITFSIDGRFAYPSTGDVIDVASRKVVAHLTDETGAAVQSEKLLEIDFIGSEPQRAGCQFGVGKVTSPPVPAKGPG
jgi:flagellar basal body-associated protein FliL